MKNKKGFVFLESVIVLVVVALALTGFLTTYTLLSNNAKKREYYDKISDKYLLYAISSMGTNGKNNYTTCTTGNSISFSKETVDNTCLTNYFFANANETGNMFDAAGLVYLYYVEDIQTALKNNPTEKYDNGAIEYMKTLPVNKENYLIGVFRRSDRFYYASINLDKTANSNTIVGFTTFNLVYGNGSNDKKEITAMEKQTIKVPYTTTKVHFELSVNDVDAQVGISGGQFTTDDHSDGKYITRDITIGDSSVEVKISITPQGTSKKREYTIIIEKEANPVEPVTGDDGEITPRPSDEITPIDPDETG